MRLLKLMLCLVICLSLAVIASAHSGKTDDYGGHIDNSNGEYHYHHGYPAHQHRDMDGNGSLDCPYLFKDKTESSSDKIEHPTDKPESPKEATKAKKIKDYLIPIICCLLLLGIIWVIDEIKWRLKK